MTRRPKTLASIVLIATLLAVPVVVTASDSPPEEIFTVDGDVEFPVRTDGPAPAYPLLAKKERVQGRCVARLVIGKEGAVETIEIVESRGEAFDRSVREAVGQWEYEPATRHGEPVAVYFNVTINFKLNGDGDKATEKSSDDER